MNERRQEPPAGVILCGGRGIRMGGVDKGLLTMGGKPAVTLAADTLRPLCAELYINANRNLERYEALSLGAVVPDRRPDFPGPLAGLEAVAAHVQRDRLLVLPCDMPRLSAAVPEMLLRALDARPSLDVLYARTSSDHHYLVAAIRQHALRVLPTLLDNGQRAVRSWYRELHCEALEMPDGLAADFANLNDAKDATEAGLSR